LPENGENGSFFFFQFEVSLQNWHTSYYWPRQGKSKGATFQTFFSISDAVPHFLNGPYEIPKQLAVEKNLESKSIHERNCWK